MYRIYEDHVDRLPFVRIKKIELTNIKSVKHGVLEFNCFKEYVPYDTKSDIMGLYGQNGSGKSSLVEAMDVLKGIMGGYNIGEDYLQFIDVAADYARIYVEYDFQYASGVRATVTYEARIEGKDRQNFEIKENQDDDEVPKRYFCISNEIIKTDMYADGSIGRLHPIIDTKDKLLCGDSLEEFYYDKKDAEVKGELVYLKRKTSEDSQSFVFSNALSETLNRRNTEENHTKYYEILAELDLFMSHYLYVISTRTSGLVQLRAGIPIYLPFRIKPMVFTEKTVVASNIYPNVEWAFKSINEVLATLIPELQIILKITDTTTQKGEEGKYIQLISKRGEREFPFEYESDGIIKLVSILAEFIFAYNQGSTTLVVDEFDSGIFEYLLGELLQIFENSGKGQFIFTSHNLRPLEVIDKKFIRFTTADPNNRYYKLKNVGNTNNLRDLYLREVQLGNQDVEIYRRTKSFKIAKALRAAGEGLNPNE